MAAYYRVFADKLTEAQYSDLRECLSGSAFNTFDYLGCPQTLDIVLIRDNQLAELREVFPLLKKCRVDKIINPLEST